MNKIKEMEITTLNNEKHTFYGECGLNIEGRTLMYEYMSGVTAYCPKCKKKHLFKKIQGEN